MGWGACINENKLSSPFIFLIYSLEFFYFSSNSQNSWEAISFGIGASSLAWLLNIQNPDITLNFFSFFDQVASTPIAHSIRLLVWIPNS